MTLRSTINRTLGLMTSVRNLPEFSHLPRGKKGRAIRLAYWRSLGDKRIWALILIAAGVQFAAYLVAMWFFGSQYNVFLLPRVIVVVFAMLAFSAMLFPPLMMMERHVLRPRIWAQFDELCNGCGYNLSGSANQRCPECGTSVSVQVTGKQVQTLSENRDDPQPGPM